MQTVQDTTEPRYDTLDGQTISDEERNRIIEQHLSLVRKIAGYVIRNCSRKIEYDDLVNIGVFGLIQAIKKYNRNYQVSFEDYCKIRIRGEMLDELRRLNWVPRRAYQQIREVDEAKQRLRLLYNRTPASEELADELGITLDALNTRNLITACPKMYSLNETVNTQSTGVEFADFLEDPNSRTPAQTTDAKDFFGGLLTELPRTERLVLFLYYQENLSMYQAGLLLGISESRICQIHSQAIQQLRGLFHRQR